MKKQLLILKVLALVLFSGPFLSIFSQTDTKTLPYSEDFDTTEEEMLPNGWSSIGDNPFRVVNGDEWGMQTVNGASMLMANPSYSIGRNDITFTPLFEMKAGNEYVVSFYLQMPGGVRNASFKLTVGNEQTEHSMVLVEKADTQITNWEAIEATFVPEVDGSYCFGLCVCSALSNDGFTCIDNFNITEKTNEPEIPEQFPYTEGFDTTEEDEIPVGWLSTGDNPFRVIIGEEWGMPTANGAGMLMANPSYSSGRNDVIYSPLLEMKAGTQYEVSLYLQMAGGVWDASFRLTAGNEQQDHSIVLVEKTDTKILNWELVKATFTPDTDGQYCFGLCACSSKPNDGFICVDEFAVKETTTGTEQWKPELPYLETFDDETHYTGEDFLPIGWKSEGNDQFVTCNINNVPAMSGDYYMATIPSLFTGRRDIAYTPLLEMKSDTEYTVSFYLYMPGGDNIAKLQFTAGKEQTDTAQNEVLTEIQDRRIHNWEQIVLKYTPETDGQYCFAFKVVSDMPYDGYTAIDDFTIKSENDIFKPVARFYTDNTLNSVFSGTPLIFEGQKVKMIDMSTDATEYEWNVTGDAEISDPYAKEPTVLFKSSGNYDISLTVTNQAGTSTASRSFMANIVQDSNKKEDAVYTTNDGIDRIYQQNDTPSFREDGTVQDNDTYEVYYDYVVGVSDYYRCFAERFEIPEERELTITSVTFTVMQYNPHIRTVSDYEDDSKKEFAVVIYQEKDGKPDIDNPVYIERRGMVDQFGDAGYYSSVMHAINFAESVKVKGTFYVALEFDELVLHPEGTVIDRSYFGAETRKHANMQTTLYVKPIMANPNTECNIDGQYVRADLFCNELEGYSFATTAWITINDDWTGLEPASTVKAYVSVDGQSIRITGTESQSKITIYSTSGETVFNGKANGNETMISISDWNNGVYILTVDGQSVKFVK